MIIVNLCEQIENLYTVTALAWKPDGSRLAVVCRVDVDSFVN